MPATEHYLRFERVDSYRRTERGLLAELHGEQLRVDVIADDVLRVKISRGGSFDEEPTFAVVSDDLSEEVTFDVAESDGLVRLSTPAAVLTLGLDPFYVDVHRPDGSAVVETATDEEGRHWAYATLNDASVVRRRCRPEDAFYGLGEKSGHFNRRGRDFTLWNTDVLDPRASGEFTAALDTDDPRSDRTSTEFDPYYASVPFFYHHRHPSGSVSGSFFDNGYRGHYDFTAADELTVHLGGGQYTEYVIVGPRMPDVLERYTALTGRMQLPPLWALGYHQCRWFDYTGEQLEALGDEHRARGVPCDSLWLDIDHMDGYRVFTWNEKSFPDPAAMLSTLRQKGFRVVTIVDPGVKRDPGYEVYDDAVARDVLCRTEGGDHYVGQVWPGSTVFPDFVSEDARDWWGDLNARHVELGCAGIWNDMNEPATGTIPPEAMRFDRGRHPHERYHNQYALLMAMATSSGLLRARPDERPFVLSRAAFSGIQRYAANWMGDNMARWDHLWLSIPMGTGFGVSGQPFVGADVGGFMGDTTAELFLRWMQQGVLTPFCRNHSVTANVDQYAWTWGPAVEDMVRDAIRLRYRLLPYLYAAFVRASETGAPVQRPLVLDHQDDVVVRDVDDQFLCGPDLLVAPVVEPGVTARHVYLPAGHWYDWHTDEHVEGRRFVVAATPMDRIPLYARAGAVIPMWPDAPSSTDGYFPSTVELHLFVPAEDGAHTSLLQEDDGTTFAALRGARLRTEFEVRRTGSRVRVSAGVTGDGYPEHRRESFTLVVHGAVPASVTVDGAEVAPDADGRFVLPESGQGFAAVLDLRSS